MSCLSCRRKATRAHRPGPAPPGQTGRRHGTHRCRAGIPENSSAAQPFSGERAGRLRTGAGRRPLVAGRGHVGARSGETRIALLALEHLPRLHQPRTGRRLRPQLPRPQDTGTWIVNTLDALQRNQPRGEHGKQAGPARGSPVWCAADRTGGSGRGQDSSTSPSRATAARATRRRIPRAVHVRLPAGTGSPCPADTGSPPGGPRRPRWPSWTVTRSAPNCCPHPGPSRAPPTIRSSPPASAAPSTASTPT